LYKTHKNQIKNQTVEASEFGVL